MTISTLSFVLPPNDIGMTLWILTSVDDRHFSDEAKKNKLVCIVADEKEAAKLGAIAIRQDVKVLATLLDAGASVSYTPVSSERKLYVHVVQTGGSVQVKTSDGREVTLKEGDAALVEKTAKLELTGNPTLLLTPTELVLFDLA